MWMSGENTKKYPDLAYWLRTDLPKIPTTRPKVWKAFQKYAGYLASPMMWNGWGKSPSFLHWGFPPEIRPHFWDCEKDGGVVPEKPGSDILVQKYAIKWYGFTAPDGSVILVSSDLARGPLDHTIEPVLEGTVLHELIHWCRQQVGKDVYDESPPYAFEKEAYGHYVQRTWQSCMSVEKYIPKP